MLLNDTIITSEIEAGPSHSPLAAPAQAPTLGEHVISMVLWILAQTDWEAVIEMAESPIDCGSAELVGCGVADLDGAGA